MTSAFKAAGRGRMLSAVAVLAIAVAAVLLPTASARSDPPGQLVQVQLLGFNDYHGYLESTGNPNPGNVGADPAGGGEYLSTKLKQLRAGHKYSLTVAAGDLIGGSPFLSGLFHDEPSVESLNEMGLDVSSVGNHEFDEGVTELLRMQNGGCHPADGCYFPGAPYAGADFNWLAANTVNDATGETPLPPYWIKTIESVKIGFIGMTLQATDTLVAQAGIKGWSFEDEAETANALVPELKRQGVEAIVVLLHEGGSQIPPPGAVNACAGISGPIVDINKALDSEIDAVITGHTHLPYNCTLEGRIVTSAYSFGRVITEVDLVLDKRTNDVRRDLSTAVNHAVIRSAAHGRSRDHRGHQQVEAARGRDRQAGGRQHHGRHHAGVHRNVRGSRLRVEPREHDRRRPALGDAGQCGADRVHEPRGDPSGSSLRSLGC